MTYAHVLEQTSKGYSAVVPALPGCQVGGATREEALTNATRAIGRRLEQVEVTTVRVDGGVGNPWVEDAGILAGHPCWDDFQAGIAAARADTEASAQVEA